MGMILFETSGTFVPGDYGLSVGDTIIVNAIGGGGGGSAYKNRAAGYSGSASSFGSIVTAPGGAGGPTTNIPNNSATQCNGSQSKYSTSLYFPNGSGFSQMYTICGGFGADGYIPGVQMPAHGLDGLAIVCDLKNMYGGYYNNPFSNNTTAYTTYRGREIIIACGNGPTGSYDVTIPAQKNAQTVPRGGRGGLIDAYGTSLVGMGGIGYGAGGGASPWGNGTGFGCGGNAGTLKSAHHVITSADIAGIAVTVGDGGSGGVHNSGDSYCGGGGARGCVAVFW